MDFKSKLQNLLSAIISAITNDDTFSITVKKSDDTLVIDILVPSDKVGVVLGRADQYGINPMKHAILRICKQTGFYNGFRDVLIKIGEADGERSQHSNG